MAQLTAVPSAALRCPVLAAHAVGLDVDRWLAPHGLSLATLDARAPSVEVPLPKVVSIMQSLVDAGPPGWALRGASTLEPGAMGVLDHLCAAAPTVLASLRDFARYFDLVAHGASVSLTTGNELVVELAFPRAPEPMARAFVESTVGLLWSRLRSYLQQPHMRPAAVQLRGRADATLRDAWEHAVGIAPEFEQSGDRVRMPGSLAREPLAGSNAALRSFLDDLARSSRPAPEPTEPSTWAARTRTMLGEQPLNTELRAVARNLAVSERTLRRRLAEEDTSFAELRQQALQRRAMVLLEDRRLSPAEVAFAVGFSELSAFHRAFKRWTGSTPVQWRAAQ
ncbi:MAG: helix-turn-helix domain-containing protein [Nannocystaceae bacterium]